MSEILLIGVWKRKDNPEYPDPIHFIDYSWDLNTRSQVIEYLKEIPPYVVAAGHDLCLLNCKQKYTSLGYCTDGYFHWPFDLLHYVESHGVRLPEKFVEHVFNKEKHIVEFGKPEDFMNINFNPSWWLTQKGWTDGKDYQPEKEGELWLLQINNKVSPEIHKFFKRFNESSYMPIIEIHKAIKEQRPILLQHHYYYSDYNALLIEADKLGVVIDFLEFKDEQAF